VPIITISRQEGSYGNEIADALCRENAMQLITREKFISTWMPEIASKHELKILSESQKFYLNTSKSGITFKDFIEKKLREEAVKTPTVIAGMGSQIIFADNIDVLKVRVIASLKVRLKRVMDKYGLDEAGAMAHIERCDRKHRRYISILYNKDWADPIMYDIVINTDNLTVDSAVEIINETFRIKKEQNYMLYNDKQSLAEKGEMAKKRKTDASSIVFKHPAEVEFAKILDMHNIEWQYEPHAFPVKWDAEGNVIRSIRPDFYLTKFDTYIEITTMDQKYVAKKNKKIKLLKELYPNININIVYKKDFESLVKRFGLNGG